MLTLPLRAFARACNGLRRFNALDKKTRAVVFYAEDEGSWAHFERIIGELTESFARDVCYLTSSETDPVLATRNERLRAFYVGAGSGRTWLFLTLRCGVLTMTMPSLERFHIKRSKVAPVHYAYLFHSIVSSHMIYLEDAFDHYDTILCSGPHHRLEVRAREAAAGLPAKRLVDLGYGRLDSILAGSGRQDTGERPRENSATRVLVAPSWGTNGLLETRAIELARTLLDAGFRVTVRPHPATIQRRRDVIESLRASFGERADFELETTVATWDSLRRADVMISDWSGVALEYAFGLERPVLFVDLPRKVNNPNYGDLGCEPLEVSIRGEIGEVISPESLEAIPGAVQTMRRERERYVQGIREARARHVYNVGASGRRGAEAILEMLELARSRQRRGVEEATTG